MLKKEVYSYLLDERDTIIGISNNWEDFAQRNSWENGGDVLGKKIWDFIEDFETQHLYEELFRRIRNGCSIQPIPFRCDSPTERRYLKMVIIPLPNYQLLVRSIILKRKKRPPVPLLDINYQRSSARVKVCSVCKKIEEKPGEWVEIENSVIHLRLFEKKEIPKITHGLCLSCYEEALLDLEVVNCESNEFTSRQNRYQL